MFVNGYFLLLFDLTSDHGTSEGHTSHPDSCNIRIEWKFKKALTVAITCLLYLEYDNCIRIDLSRIIRTDFSLSTLGRLCCLGDFVSRRLRIRSISPAFYRTVWHPHRKYRSGHRDWFALVCHSFTITLPHLLLFRFLRNASIYSLHTIVHQTELLRMGLQLGTAAGPTSKVCGKCCFLRPVHG